MYIRIHNIQIKINNKGEDVSVLIERIYIRYILEEYILEKEILNCRFQNRH